VMTTHYMEEADQLCDRLAIIDRGQLLALDTPQALKRRAPGGTLVELHLDGDASAASTAAASVSGIIRADAEGDVLRAYSDKGGRVISPLIDAVASAGRSVRNIDLAEPSLETLFISLTGRKLG
jgi:ABC-2 type transport system ATP-binding protein